MWQQWTDYLGMDAYAVYSVQNRWANLKKWSQQDAIQSGGGNRSPEFS